jgi:hypothetical protein
MFSLLLQQRNYGKPSTVEIEYADDMRAEFRADVRTYVRRLRDERLGRIRGDAPILVDILIVR